MRKTNFVYVQFCPGPTKPSRGSFYFCYTLCSPKRKKSNSGETAGIDDSGILFSAQGRYGAALKAQQEAVNAYQQLNDRSNLMISVLAEYDMLAAAGRADEGKSQIEKALSLADQTKNSPVEALNYKGDAFFYLGDYASARQQYEKALSLADKAKLKDQSLIAKLNLAKLDVVQGRAKSAIPVLRKLAQDAMAWA